MRNIKNITLSLLLLKTLQATPLDQLISNPPSKTSPVVVFGAYNTICVDTLLYPSPDDLKTVHRINQLLPEFMPIKSPTQKSYAFFLPRMAGLLMDLCQNGIRVGFYNSQRGRDDKDLIVDWLSFALRAFGQVSSESLPQTLDRSVIQGLEDSGWLNFFKQKEPARSGPGFYIDPQYIPWTYEHIFPESPGNVIFVDTSWDMMGVEPSYFPIVTVDYSSLSLINTFFRQDFWHKVDREILLSGDVTNQPESCIRAFFTQKEWNKGLLNLRKLYKESAALLGQILDAQAKAKEYATPLREGLRVVMCGNNEVPVSWVPGVNKIKVHPKRSQWIQVGEEALERFYNQAEMPYVETTIFKTGRALVLSRYIEALIADETINFNAKRDTEEEINDVYGDVIDTLLEHQYPCDKVSVTGLSPQTFIAVLSKLTQVRKEQQSRSPSLKALHINNLKRLEEDSHYAGVSKTLGEFLKAYSIQNLSYQGPIVFPFPPNLLGTVDFYFNKDETPLLLEEIQRGVFNAVDRFYLSLSYQDNAVSDLLAMLLKEIPGNKPWHEAFPMNTELYFGSDEIAPQDFADLLKLIRPKSIRFSTLRPKITREIVHYAQVHRLEKVQGNLEYKLSSTENIEILKPFLRQQTYPVWQLGHAYSIQKHFNFNAARTKYLASRNNSTDPDVRESALEKFMYEALRYPFWYTHKTDTPELPGRELWSMIKAYEDDSFYKAPKDNWPLEETFKAYCGYSSDMQITVDPLSDLLKAFIQMDYLVKDGPVKRIKVHFYQGEPNLSTYPIINEFLTHFSGMIDLYWSIGKDKNYKDFWHISKGDSAQADATKAVTLYNNIFATPVEKW